MTGVDHEGRQQKTSTNLLELWEGWRDLVTLPPLLDQCGPSN